ncbi:hypothetical protein LPJ77_005267 [Coemansia sp. RSA 2523]|nr:hypothetical protein LPJ69_005009 [Coemansia sp. RSA 1752]KAJ1768308.1 hypothetical protein LPJ54_005068 [Coemansia sp. RSA 1824]KAJ1782889.1 hypothetical protein LPJ67_004924 [Coemansia sp. RSA 1938]KAJ1783387.1 hypothetical protein LPJ62_005060 [Coemansia sp. RSA 2167]KAJ1803414.1 hypothetical protein LPJ77_005267 [Coemansia sp. RSA 2523]KAJ2107413.1 hypothetical protein GGF48_006012 [Coemansia sp. RSA 921]KAJ2119320.1 hypothetical protein GGH17_005619 [Coemansia sp. RSA 788]KAJ2140207.
MLSRTKTLTAGHRLCALGRRNMWIAGRRLYTNTSVYTRGDYMSHEQHMQALMEEQQYLTGLLKTDDSEAPWRRENVETVSREVQENLHLPKWKPEDVFHG